MSAFEGKADINRKVPQCSVSAKSNTKWACGNPTRYDLTSTMIFPTTIATAIIFILTYIGVSLGRIPGFRLDRAGIALGPQAIRAGPCRSTARLACDCDERNLGRQSHPSRLGCQPHRSERARAAGIEISFWAYCRAGIPITISTLALGAWWLS